MVLHQRNAFGGAWKFRYYTAAPDYWHLLDDIWRVLLDSEYRQPTRAAHSPRGIGLMRPSSPSRRWAVACRKSGIDVLHDYFHGAIIDSV